MSEIDPPLVEWSELGVSGLLPTGTVTLLLADVEGPTRLWETQPDEMTTAIARLNRVVSDVIAAHDGVRPVEQCEGDSFVAAFARASDAVAAALESQRAPLAPIRLRIGTSGEIQLRDEGNYAGPTINRTARLRDLGHGGQTLLSGATEQLVVDRLPEGAWVTDLGTHPLRDLPRPERVVQLCHPDLVNELSPLRVSKAVVSQRLPVQLTSFVGHRAGFVRCRWYLGLAQLAQGDCAGAVEHFRTAGAAAEAGHYANFQKYTLAFQGVALAWQGDTRAARAAASEALEGGDDELGSLNAGLAYTALGMAALAVGDAAAARNATAAACRHARGAPPGMAALSRAFSAQAARADRDLSAARRAADEAITTAAGWYSMWALITRAGGARAG